MPRPNAHALAVREDRAFAALMGAHGGSSDFGKEYDRFVLQPKSSDFGYTPEFAGDEDVLDFSDFGYTPEFGADLPTSGEVPPPHVAVALWQQHKRDGMRTNQRTQLLEPNRGSKVKVEKYCFGLNQALVIGTAASVSAERSPSASIRPQRVCVNAPTPAFGTFSDMKVANVSVILGGSIDAFQWSAFGVGVALDMPTLSPSNSATVTGLYTGFVPPGFAGGFAFPYCIGLTGPASIIA